MAFKVHSKETSFVNECDKPNPNLRHIKQMLITKTFSKETLIKAMSAAIANSSYTLIELLSEYVDVPKLKICKHRISNLMEMSWVFDSGVSCSVVGREDERMKTYNKLQITLRKCKIKRLMADDS